MPNKKGLGTTSIIIGVSSYILLNAQSIQYVSNSVNLLTGVGSVDVGKKNRIEFQYSNGIGLIKLNGTPLVTTTLSGDSSFDRVQYLSASPFDGQIYSLSLYPYRCSEAESVLADNFLKSIFPEIESVVIGGYEITTQNAENIVATDGTSVPEVQGNSADENAEKITSTDFTNWDRGASVTSFGNLTFTTNAAGSCSSTTFLSLNKPNKNRIVGTSNVAWSFCDGSTTIISVPSGAFDLTQYWRYSTSLRILLSGAGTIAFTTLSDKEAGWADSTAIYDQVYATTNGSVKVKELAAQKAAAMYSNYTTLNTDADRAAYSAIYGKLFNWYAAVLLAPKGWHLPSSAELTQIQTYKGGSAVAGGKMKALFGGFNNAFSSNESGLSLIAGGFRNTLAAFSSNDTVSRIWALNTNRLGVLSSDSATTITSVDKIFGFALRYIRDTPYGDQFKTVTNSTVTNIASVALNTVIHWGYRPKAIRIVSTTNLTAIEAKLLNTSAAVVATLITGKTANATDITFPVLADFSVGYTDYSVAITAAGNTDLGTQVFILLEKTPA